MPAGIAVTLTVTGRIVTAVIATVTVMAAATVVPAMMATAVIAVAGGLRIRRGHAQRQHRAEGCYGKRSHLHDQALSDGWVVTLLPKTTEPGKYPDRPPPIPFTCWQAWNHHRPGAAGPERL